MGMRGTQVRPHSENDHRRKAVSGIMKILVINPGSTSTKLALFEGEKELCTEKLDHSAEDLRAYATPYDQYPFRLAIVRAFLDKNGVSAASLDAVVARGGLVRPIPCGTYLVNDRMLEDLRAGVCGVHASNLAPALARGIADEAQIPAFIVDPITVDELEPVARITGRPDIMRESRLHTLNQKAVARQVAAQLGGRYEDMNFVVAHLGTGTSIAAHRKGRVVDMCDARGEGPMSCDRCGGVNTYLALEEARRHSADAETFIMDMYTRGGLFAHLGTKDIREVEARIDAGDAYAALILDAMIYQCAKEIGAQAAVLSGEVDRIILTGGIAYDVKRMDQLTAMVRFIAPVTVVPGEEEMKALALGAIRVLSGEEQAKRYYED